MSETEEQAFLDAARAEADEVRRIVKELLPHPALRSLDGMQVEFIVQETLRSAATRGEPSEGMVERGVLASEMEMEAGMAKRQVPAKIVRRILRAALSPEARDAD